MTGNSNATGQGWVDPDDAPELTDAWFESADQYRGGRLVRRGRPPVEHPKKLQSFKLSQDVIAAIKASGRGYNARVEEILRAAFIKP